MQAVEQMWVRQEVRAYSFYNTSKCTSNITADALFTKNNTNCTQVKATQLYSAPGQILNCPGLEAVLGRDEVIFIFVLYYLGRCYQPLEII